ncbi:MAG TPA: AMP-binding protein [Burkholderiales bacterium]|nr:AMP-binding protein [Burkholderiales bacterium]
MLKGCVPWPEEFARRYRERGYWRDITIGEQLDAAISRWPDREALVSGDERVTYRQLGLRIDRLAARLTQAGLKPLDRVVLQLPNIPEFIYAYYALVRIGVIPVMAMRAHRHTEVRHFVNSSGAVGWFIPGVFGNFDFPAMADEVKVDCPTLTHVFVAGTPRTGQIALGPMIAEPADEREVSTALNRLRPDPSEVALMLLSGGTTALPKLIPRTHNDYVYNAIQCAHVAGFGDNTVYMAVLPLAHNYNLSSPGIMGAFACGGKVVLAPAPDAETVFPIVERERVTIIAAAVPLVANWLNSSVPRRCDISSLKVIQNGGARLAPELRQRVRDELGCTPQEIYGTAEGLINIVRLDDDEEALLHSSGAPVSPDDEIKVVDDSDHEVPDGEPGELLTRGPYTIRGYYNNVEKNKEAFTADGFYRMGDIVRKRGRHVYTEGRRKDLINRGGEKISCDEIENYIFAHPKVKSVTLVAMPDEVFGEKACAFVIPKPGETLTFGELIAFLRAQKIASFKLPERLELLAEFPLSPAGKILKRTLRERITAQLAAEKAAPK